MLNAQFWTDANKFLSSATQAQLIVAKSKAYDLRRETKDRDFKNALNKVIRAIEREQVARLEVILATKRHKELTFRETPLALAC